MPPPPPTQLLRGSDGAPHPTIASLQAAETRLLARAALDAATTAHDHARGPISTGAAAAYDRSECRRLRAEAEDRAEAAMRECARAYAAAEKASRVICAVEREGVRAEVPGLERKRGRDWRGEEEADEEERRKRARGWDGRAAVGRAEDPGRVRGERVDYPESYRPSDRGGIAPFYPSPARPRSRGRDMGRVPRGPRAQTPLADRRPGAMMGRYRVGSPVRKQAQSNGNSAAQSVPSGKKKNYGRGNGYQGRSPKKAASTLAKATKVKNGSEAVTDKDVSDEVQRDVEETDRAMEVTEPTGVDEHDRSPKRSDVHVEDELVVVNERNDAEESADTEAHFSATAGATTSVHGSTATDTIPGNNHDAPTTAGAAAPGGPKVEALEEGELAGELDYQELPKTDAGDESYVSVGDLSTVSDGDSRKERYFTL